MAVQNLIACLMFMTSACVHKIAVAALQPAAVSKDWWFRYLICHQNLARR